MGVPDINIAFKTLGVNAIKQGSKGVVALILKDTVYKTNPLVLENIDDLPSDVGLKEENKEQIRLAFKGYITTPKKVIVYVLSEESKDLKDAKNYLETMIWDYLAIPDIEENQLEDIGSWIKNLRKNKKKVVAVLPKHKGDHEGIINYTNECNKTINKTYSAKEYCSRIAGMLAGTPLNLSLTFGVLKELIDCDHLSLEEQNKRIDNGELILINDGEKVKIGRAVNSLTTLTEGTGEDYKKIKIVGIMDMITTSITKTFSDKYIGKFGCSYDNKCLLIAAINGFLEELERSNLLAKGKNFVGIDIEANKLLLKKKGLDISLLSEKEIKQVDTGSNVLLSGKCRPLDAMEDLNILFEMM